MKKATPINIWHIVYSCYSHYSIVFGKGKLISYSTVVSELGYLRNVTIGNFDREGKKLVENAEMLSNFVVNYRLTKIREAVTMFEGHY